MRAFHVLGPLCLMLVLLGCWELSAEESGSRDEVVHDFSSGGIDRAPALALDELLARKPRRRNVHLITSVEDILRKMKSKEDITLIDIRSEGEYALARIPGSIHVPLYALKTKQFLKYKPLILVGQGHSYSHLETECEHLRKAGFLPAILEGGLNEWKRRGGPLEGASMAASGLNRMQAGAYFVERHYLNWTALGSCRSSKEEASRYIPEAVFLDCPDDAEQFLPCFKTALAGLARQKGNSLPYVLVFDEDGRGYTAMEEALRGAGLKNVFFMQGGLNAYKNFVVQQVSLLRAGNTSRRGRIAERCPSCQ